MRRLIYLSRWSEAGRANFDGAVLDILSRSISNNRLCDVTGALLVGHGCFLQALEGPSAAVAETYSRIGADPRHKDLFLVADADADAREFSDWNMCAVPLDQVMEHLGCEEVDFPPLDPGEALRLLKAAAAAQRQADRNLAPRRAA